jgi:DDE superfamily endonuclease
MEFCHEHNIILVQFPSHSTHKLQPCDIGVFAPLKNYYSEGIDALCRGGVIAIGKQHFTEMYSKSRAKALTNRNIKAVWAKAGIYPGNPDRVLRTILKPLAENSFSKPTANPLPQDKMPLRIPVTFDKVKSMRRFTEQKFHSLDPDTRYCVEKLAKSTERVITARDLLFQENEELIKQTNANSTRTSRKSIVVGKAKVMSCEDIEKEIQRREEKEAARGSRRGRKGKKAGATPGGRQRSREEEIESANREFEREEWGIYGSVF